MREIEAIALFFAVPLFIFVMLRWLLWLGLLSNCKKSGNASPTVISILGANLLYSLFIPQVFVPSFCLKMYFEFFSSSNWFELFEGFAWRIIFPLLAASAVGLVMLKFMRHSEISFPYRLFISLTAFISIMFIAYSSLNCRFVFSGMPVVMAIFSWPLVGLSGAAAIFYFAREYEAMRTANFAVGAACIAALLIQLFYLDFIFNLEMSSGPRVEH
jgi:hypothetical protein